MIRHPVAVPYILCFDATTDRLWAAAVSLTGKIILTRTGLIRSGPERSQKMVRIIKAVWQAAGGRPAAVATVVGPATPGGVRLGATIANALAFAWQLPVRSCLKVNDQLVKFGPRLKAGQLRPRYSHQPHIT